MPAKRKTKKKQTKSRTTVAKKTRPSQKKVARKRQTARKQSSKKSPAQKKRAVKAKTIRKKKTIVAKTANSLKRQRPEKSQIENVRVSSEGPGTRSGRQSGDLQGLSRVEGADSESVDELIEEGNAFEADVVAGVERAEDTDEGEVQTHEVPEDDVPGEYLDKD